MALCLGLAGTGCITPAQQTTRMTSQSSATPPPVVPQSVTASNMPQAKKSEADKLKSKINILMSKANEEAKLAQVGTAGISTDGKTLNKTENAELEKTALADLARSDYQEVIKLDPKHLPAYQGLARMYLKLGQKDRALETINQALAQAPRDANLLYDLALCQLCRRDYNEAETTLRRALEIDPENRQFRKQLGLTLAREGQFDRSIEVLTQVYAGPAYAHYLVARMLDGVFGQPEACKEHLRLALAANPNLNEARSLLSEMENPAPRPSLAQPTELQSPSMFLAD